MATAVPTPTPNPLARKLTVDATFPEMVNATDADAAAVHPFIAAVFALDGVASVFAMNDFVTVTRTAGTDWDAITPGVQSLAADLL
jgi:hypothetical protein